VAELDEEYLRRMEDVLALYEKPLSEKEPVVCIDEKPVVLHADLRPPRPMHPGRIIRRDCEYKRCGTANAFCGVEPKVGQHFTRVTPDRSSPEFADYLLEIAEHCCPAKSRTESTDCRCRINRYRSRTPEVPVKWAFSRKE
jgi:DDE superfamily endonuclease